MYYLDDFPTEILANIFLSSSSISDAINLASTCHRFYDLFTARRLAILRQAAQAEFGPIQDVIQLVTHNASQPAHIHRTVPFSFALLQEVVQIGRTAKRWEDIYPFKKWKVDFQNRRLLTADERYTFRRALYRLWLYSRAFHNQQHARYSRVNRTVVLERAKLLHNWSTAELGEIADVRHVVREVVSANVCPSNGTIQKKFRKCFPETNYQLLFNMHLNYPPPAAPSQSLHYTNHHPQSADKYYAKYKPTPFHEPGEEGWGDDIHHYYVIEDMLKLDPEQILWLRDNAPSKGHVETYVRGLGEWFDNNGETFGQTLEFVLAERGSDAAEFLEAVAEGELGVALEDE